MKEILLNDYFRIEPIIHDTFVVVDKTTYEEVGKIVGMPQYGSWDTFQHYLGGIAYFDSYIAKKYPVIGGKPNEFQWFVPFSEIVKIELPEGGESSSGKTAVSKTANEGSTPSSPAQCSIVDT